MILIARHFHVIFTKSSFEKKIFSENSTECEELFYFGMCLKLDSKIMNVQMSVCT